MAENGSEDDFNCRLEKIDRPRYVPFMLAEEEIRRMTPAERLSAMERLWESFVTEGLDYPSPDWHRAVLKERAELIDSGKANWLSVDELQTRLQDR